MCGNYYYVAIPIIDDVIVKNYKIIKTIRFCNIKLILFGRRRLFHNNRLMQVISDNFWLCYNYVNILTFCFYVFLP